MDENRAAAVIQSCFRGYRARKLYTLESWRRYEKEETERRGEQEGEMLVVRHEFQQDSAENTTLSRNELWRLNAVATRIQKAWRTHQRKVKDGTSDDEVLSAETILPETVASSCPQRVHNGSPSTITALERLVRQVEAVLPQEGDEFEEMFEYPTDVFTEHRSGSDKSHEHMIDDGVKVEQKTEAESSPLNSLQDVYPSPSIPRGSDTIQHCVLQHSREENTELHDTSSGDAQQAKSDCKSAVNVIGKYHLLYSIELSDSSEEELHTNQHMTNELKATCHDAPQDAKTFEFDEVGTADLQVARTPLYHHHTLQRFPNYYFEGSEEFVYSEDFQTHHEFRHRTAYEGTKTGSGHAGHGVAFDHGLTPLFGMSVLQLKQLLLSLKTRIEGTSLVLVELLQERDSMRAENELLQANIAQLARTLQDLYSPQTKPSSKSNYSR